MKKCIILLIANLFIIGCSSAPTPTTYPWKLNLPVISKSVTKPPASDVKKLSQVNEKFCSTDGKLSTRMGMVDTVTQKAQTKTSADYILDANYTLEGINCLVLKGTAAK